MTDDFGKLDGALSNELHEPVVHGLIKWQQEHSCKLRLIRKFTTGYTEAFVGLVAANDATGGRKVILKADRGSLNDEAAAHSAAMRYAPPKFSQDHFVTQEYEAIRLPENWFVMFQGIAGGGISELKPLSVYTGRSTLRDIMPRIADSVMNEWNPAPILTSSTIGEFLDWHVKNKLRPDGRLWKWAQSQLGADAVTATFLQFGESEDSKKTINPFAVSVDEKIAEFALQVFTGSVHGDLHMENVLVRVGAAHSDFSYHLIDLATYSNSGPLSRDLVNLFLSEVEHVLPSLSAAERIELLMALSSNRREVSTTIAACVDLWGAIQRVGRDQVVSRGVRDDWKRQIELSLVGAALQSASRLHRDLRDRMWFFELASLTLHETLSNLDLIPSAGATCAVNWAELDKPSTAREAANTVTAACGAYNGECFTIAVMDLPEFKPLGRSDIALSAWNVVVDFDPFSDQTGLFNVCQAREASHRWMTDREGTSANSMSTIWIPGVELASPAGRYNDVSTLRWRSSEMPRIRKAITEVLSVNSGPITIVHFGTVTSKSRAVLECIFDLVGERASVVTISYHDQAEAAQLEPLVICEDPLDVLLELPPRFMRFPHLTGSATVPGGDGRVQVSERDLLRYSDVGDLLHSNVEATREVDANSEGGFYRGRRISWLELSEAQDIPREVAKSLRVTVEELLADRGTYRHIIKHSPGSGGSTVARKLAWDLHLDHPTLVLDSIPSISPVVERISELAELTSRQCLVLIDNALESAVSDLYNHLRARSTPVLLLVVHRRNLLNGSMGPDKGVGVLTRDEQGHFSRQFKSFASNDAARNRIDGIGHPGGDPAVPFFYALNAFQSKYEGLTPFVQGFLSSQTEEVLSALVDVALVHRFGAKSLPATVIAGFLGGQGNPNIFVRNRFKSLDGLLLEAPLGCWRTAHPLIAEELLRQRLANEAGISPKYWTSALVTASKDLIIRLSEAYQGELPGIVPEILKQLFILRDAREESQSEYPLLFSELIVTVPSYPGRDSIFSTLIEHFPDDPHFLAHYARLKSYQAKEYAGARRLIDAAVDISGSDPLLHNIKGVVVRNEIDRLLNEYPPKLWLEDRSHRERVAELLFDAIDSFKKADELDGRSEQNMLLILQMVNKVIPRVKPRELTFSEFLTRPTASALAEALDEAEDAADKIEEMSKDFKLSEKVQGALADLRGLNDDHSGMMQGWRGLLDTSQGPKIPIRSRLARLYWDRSGSGSDVSNTKHAFNLLNENLRDDPFDARTIRMWLKVARSQGASVDQAALYCTNWVERQPEREAFFYDWATSALLLLGGRNGETNDYMRKLRRLRTAAENLPSFRGVSEWIGFGDDLGQLVSAKDPRLVNWIRRDQDSVEPECLRRVEARVVRIDKPQSGILLLEDGLEAFFTPAVANLRKGQDERAIVSALIGLSNDGPIAWGVQRKAVPKRVS